MSDKVINGVPSTVLLPAKRDSWKYVSGPHALDVGFFDLHGVGIVGYSLAEDIDVLVDLGNITKALYQNKLYPELEDNQVFSIRNILVDNEGKRVTVVGNVLERL